MTHICELLRAFLLSIRGQIVRPDPEDTAARDAARLLLLTDDVHPRPMSAERQWDMARTCAACGLYHLAADWIIAATSRDGIPRVEP
jgi:hypothetical protein